MLEVEGLAAFVAIARKGSFVRAAEELGVAQSVISKRLRRLEDQLGAKLIDRTVRNAISLTRTGALYLPEAEVTLRQLERAARTGRDLAFGRVGPVRIGYIFSAALNGTLTRLLATLRADLPTIELQPFLMETPEQLRALEAGRLDIALVRPRPSYPAECETFLVHSESLLIFHAVAHPFAATATVAAHQLADSCFITPQFAEQVGLIDHVETLAKAGGFAVGRLIRTGDYVTAAALVAANEGVALAPASLGNCGIEGLVGRSVTDCQQTIDIMLASRADLPSEQRHSVRKMAVG